MANKTKTARQKEETREKGPETPEPPLLLLDLSNAAATKMIKQATKRGYVTYEQLNSVTRSEEVTSEQIEDILAVLNQMGVNVVETEEVKVEEEEAHDVRATTIVTTRSDASRPPATIDRDQCDGAVRCIADLSVFVRRQARWRPSP